jgi:fermentation-respiration switch protein FrsA (DUF1100 family)
MTLTSTNPRLRQTSIARRLLFLLLAALLAYGAGAVWLMTQETRLVFQAGRPLGTGRPSAPLEQIDIFRQDGLRQFAWIMKNVEGPNGPWVLFLHGNRATISSRVNILRYEQLRGLGMNVMAPEYRGFGGLDGTPTESAFYADARAAYDHLRQRLGIPAERIAIYGWSLGGAVAVDLASNVPEAAVILEGAPASLVAIGQAQYPYFPIRLLMRNPFHAVQKVSHIKAPLLFLHSPADAVIPIAEGRRLFDAATAPKTFVEVRGSHVDAAEIDSVTFLAAIRKLLRDTRLTPGEKPAELGQLR